MCSYQLCDFLSNALYTAACYTTNILYVGIFEAFNGGDVSSRGLVGCDPVWCCGRIPVFQRSMLPPSSG
jgi:hypothetical protein